MSVPRTLYRQGDFSACGCAPVIVLPVCIVFVYVRVPMPVRAASVSLCTYLHQ